MKFAVTESARTLLAICLASVCWGFSFGLGAPLASLWLQDAGQHAAVIGLNTGIYYLGIALAAAFVPWAMRRWGRASLIVGMVGSALSVAAFPWGGGLIGWFLLRLGNGLAAALSLIPMETLVNHTCPPTQRSRNFGFYAFSIALGIALGTVVGVQLYPSAPAAAFLLGGLAALAAGAVILGWLEWPVLPTEESHEWAPLHWRRNFLCFGSAWSQGFLEGGMISLMPIYLLAIGLSEAGTGWLIGGIMIGVILFQVPVAWLADRFGRTPVLLGCYLVTALMLGFLALGTPVTALALCLFLTGACSGAFYPLGLAVLGERLPPAGLARANAWYLAINCLGSLMGPSLTGAAMDRFGRQAFFTAGLAAVLGILVIWAVIQIALHLRQPKAVPQPAPDLESRRAA